MELLIYRCMTCKSEIEINRDSQTVILIGKPCIKCSSGMLLYDTKIVEDKSTIKYDRETLALIIAYHYKKDISSCGCGWNELGKSHPHHVLDVYEATIEFMEE